MRDWQRPGGCHPHFCPPSAVPGPQLVTPRNYCRDMARKDPHQGKLVQEGTLAGHYREGNTYKPPLIAYPAAAPSDWIKEDFPDLLWPASLAVLEGHPSGKLFADAQQLVVNVLGRDQALAGPPFDGRLSSLGRVDETLRTRIQRAMLESHLAERLFPEQLLAVLQLYDTYPGDWLFNPAVSSGGSLPQPEEAVQFLLRVLVAAIKDGSVNALTKLPTLGWRVVTQSGSFDSKVVELLRDYPINLETRPMAEATIRSSFMAMKAANSYSDPQAMPLATEWTEGFWRQNMEFTQCVLEEAALPEQTTREELIGSDIVDGLLQQLRASYQTFVEAAAAAQSEVATARHEVLTGHVVRAYRALEALIRAPHMWTGEHASPVTRLLFEAQIFIRWMLQRGNDEVFLEYQSYGLGKRKLLKQHVKSLLERLGDGAPDMLKAYAESLEQKTGGDWGDQFQAVSLDSTFSGLTVRQMAEQVGMLDEYRHVYQSASGISHGEWWAIQDYAMQRCQNPLHLFHHLPSLEEFRSEPEFVGTLINFFDRLIDEVIDGFGIEFETDGPPRDTDDEGAS